LIQNKGDKIKFNSSFVGRYDNKFEGLMSNLNWIYY